MRHGADVARAHGDDDVAIADHVLERLGELLDLSTNNGSSCRGCALRGR